MILKSEGKRFQYAILLASLYLIAQGIDFNPLRIFSPLLGIIPTTHNIFNDLRGETISAIRENYTKSDNGEFVKSSVDLSVMLNAFPHLKKNPGIFIVGYYMHDFMGGMGLALPYKIPDADPAPADSGKYMDHFPDRSNLFNSDPGEASLPANFKRIPLESTFALDDSDQSFIEAAIFYNEMNAFGEYWHTAFWGTERIISGLDNTALIKRISGKADKPQASIYGSIADHFNILKYLSWNPKVIHTWDSKVKVVYYTYSGHLSHHITRHTHVFSLPSYEQKTDQKTILEFGQGYIM